MMDKLKAVAKKFAEDHPPPKGYDRIPLPQFVEGTRELSVEDKWKSLLWNIDSAERFGTEALQSLSIAFARIIQAEALSYMHFDTRHSGQMKFEEEYLLWNFHKAITQDKRSLYDLLIKIEPVGPVDLSKSIVLSKPWERWRLLKAYQKLGPDKEDGPFKQTPNFQAKIWTPWPIVWVTNGFHTSFATAILDRGSVENIESYSANEILINVYCDGKYWRRISDKKSIGRVRSLPMAGIFEIGRRLISAPNPK